MITLLFNRLTKLFFAFYHLATSMSCSWPYVPKKTGDHTERQSETDIRKMTGLWKLECMIKEKDWDGWDMSWEWMTPEFLIWLHSGSEVVARENRSSQENWMNIVKTWRAWHGHDVGRSCRTGSRQSTQMHPLGCQRSKEMSWDKNDTKKNRITTEPCH